jgi:hypothetical protein
MTEQGEQIKQDAAAATRLKTSLAPDEMAAPS